MKRKFYANLASSHNQVRMTDRFCSRGHRLAEEIMVTPEPYIVVPPFRRTPKHYRAQLEILGEWCRECN